MTATEPAPDELAKCYSRLVHVGFTWAPTDIVEGLDGAPREAESAAWVAAVARWSKDVAEPFFEAMQQRSAADGLAVRCWIGSDNSISDVRNNLVGFAAMVRPNQEPYNPRERFFDARLLRLMERDWGNALQAARQSNPYDYARERAEAERDRRIKRLGGWASFYRLRMRGDPRADGIV